MASIVSAVCCFAVDAARSAPQRVLLDDRLEARRITLLSLDGESIVYEDARGRRREATFGGFTAMLPVAEERISANATLDRRSGFETGLLELTDGQRFPGQTAATGGTGEALVWSHPAFGRLTAPLERIAQVAMNEPEQGPSLSSENGELFEDRLLLVNGDRLSGFLLGLGDPVEFETDSDVLRIPLERIAAARLANEQESLQGLAVWLEDGTVAVVESLRARDQEQSLRLRLPDGQTADYAMSDVRAVAFDASRLRALADLEPIEQRAVGDRPLLDGLTPLPAPTGGSAADLNAPDLLLPGPMRVRWEIPAQARRLSAIAELPLDALPWGDCEVVVAVDGVERMRERLDRNHRRVRFSAPLDGSELEIRIEPGRGGPINDRVILRRPLILLEPVNESR